MRTTTVPELEWVRPPLQARSRETLERLLDAAEEIFDEKRVEEATVAEVARRAGSSIGSFYARFHDKEGLVRSVFERFAEQAVMTAEVALVPARWEGVPIEEALETMARFVIVVLDKKRGLVSALVGRAPVDSALTRLGERLVERVAALLAALLAARGLRPRHPSPRLALEVAVWLFLSGLELRAVSRLHGAPGLSDADAARELARVCARYLGIDAADGPARRGNGAAKAATATKAVGKAATATKATKAATATKAVGKAATATKAVGKTAKAATAATATKAVGKTATAAKATNAVKATRRGNGSGNGTR